MEGIYSRRAWCGVGDGEKIDVWNHNWIPRSRADAEVEKVKHLLLPGGAGWDISKLNDTFFEADVSDILKIPVGRAGTDDYVASNYTKTGQFSVRSAYHLKQHLKCMAAGWPWSSLNCTEHQGWLSLWAANVPSKVKVHCWRLAKNGLAVACWRGAAEKDYKTGGAIYSMQQGRTDLP
jgi:hypothetical protein